MLGLVDDSAKHLEAEKQWELIVKKGYSLEGERRLFRFDLLKGIEYTVDSCQS
jgi:hypothetical protein